MVTALPRPRSWSDPGFWLRQRPGMILLAGDAARNHFPGESYLALGIVVSTSSSYLVPISSRFVLYRLVVDLYISPLVV